MARGIEITGIDPAALQLLATQLCAIWTDLSPPFRVFNAPSGANASQGNHLVVADRDGIDAGTHIGLKAAQRIVEGTLKEILVADISMVLGLSCASSLHLLGPIANLGTLSGKTFFAVRWLATAEVFEKITDSVKQAVRDHPERFLTCFGEWMGLGLTFGVQDRHNGNWVCSSDGSAVAMIDNEDAFGAAGDPSAYQGALQHFGLLDLIRAERTAGAGPHLQHLGAGLRRFADNFAARRAAVDAALARHPWAQSYNSRWMGLTVDEFVQAALAGL